MDRTVELDIYCGDLTGLITAEVEFDTLEQQVNFVPPSWFGEDVTENERYKNRNLSAKGSSPLIFYCIKCSSAFRGLSCKYQKL